MPQEVGCNSRIILFSWCLLVGGLLAQRCRMFNPVFDVVNHHEHGPES